MPGIKVKKEVLNKFEGLFWMTLKYFIFLSEIFEKNKKGSNFAVPYARGIFYVVLLHIMVIKGGYQSGQLGRTVNPLSYDFEGSNPSPPTVALPMPWRRRSAVAKAGAYTRIR